MKPKYWQILLREWRKQGNDGFSIPFIIGSQVHLPSDHTYQSIHELIIDMVGNRDEVVFIKYCLNAKDLILGIRDKSKERIPGHFPSFHGSLQSGFFVTYFLDDLGQTMEDIIVTLSSRYQKRIDDKEYSINDGERGHYTSSEGDFISRCFSIYSH